MQITMRNNAAKRMVALLFALALLLTVPVVGFADTKKKKEKFDSWQAVALRMAEVFDEAVDFVEKDDYKAAYDKMNEAYFSYYEVQGFEATVMNSISRNRVGHIEGLFRDTKHVLLGNMDGSKEDIIASIESLKVKVYRDAMVLDGVVDEESEDAVGEAVYGERGAPKLAGQLKYEKGDGSAQGEAKGEESKTESKPIIQEVDPKTKNHKTFMTTYILLLREGLEAILVIVAIITYLIKTGNAHLCKKVYNGVFLAIIASIILAVIIELAVENSGVARELIEGWTMFIAVALLFYVSNWILSKSSEEKWDDFIQGKVKSSIDKKSQNTLVFAAFLAVFREGAELILFYKAAFAGGQNSVPHIMYGILAGTVTLIVVYVLFRYTTIKLPLKPFFLFTSVLLFLMCVSFMGKGVIELTEANVITGSTTIEPIKNFSIELLNMYPRAEILIPQIMLIIAAGWILLKHIFSSKGQKQK